MCIDFNNNFNENTTEYNIHMKLLASGQHSFQFVLIIRNNMENSNVNMITFTPKSITNKSIYEYESIYWSLLC